MKLRQRLLFLLSSGALVSTALLLLLASTVEVDVSLERPDGSGDMPPGIPPGTPPTTSPRTLGTPGPAANVSLSDVLRVRRLLHAPGRYNHTRWRRQCGRDLGQMLGITAEERYLFPAWKQLHVGINECELYTDDYSLISQLLHDMRRSAVDEVDMFEGGTQLKLLVTLEDESSVILKPQRMRREDQTLADHFYFVDYERHNAEIASFHVDRLLGFRRVPPTVGRVLNMTSELYQKADEDLGKTFFISPGNNVCFTGVCSYYCDTPHAVCGRGAGHDAGHTGDSLEVSLALMLPQHSLLRRSVWKHPWKRSYHRKKLAPWEGLDGAAAREYCQSVRRATGDTTGDTPASTGRSRMLDLMDTAVFDFIIGNMDRHHYETFHLSDNHTFIIHLDQGRAFGRYDHDEMSILAPVSHCCLVRASTLRTLMGYYRHPEETRRRTGYLTLGESLERAMRDDLLQPVLYAAHYTAVNRRLALVLELIMNCLHKGHVDHIIVDDGY